MFRKKITTRVSRLLLVGLLLFSVVQQFLLVPSVVYADSSMDSMENVNPPSGNEEKGIWIDRGLIIVFGNSFAKAPENGSEEHEFYNTADGDSKGYYAKGSQTYEGTCPDAGKTRTITVTFSETHSEPTTGTIKDCEGKSATISLTKANRAKFDGYYENNTITMPRWLSNLKGCGALSGNNYALYSSDGTFKKDGDRYKSENDSNSYITSVNKDASNTFATGKQGRTVGGDGTGNCTMWYGGSEGSESGARTLYFGKNTTREGATRQAKNLVEKFWTSKLKEEKLSSVLDSSEGREALAGCNISKTEAIKKLLAEPTSPEKVCLQEALENNSDFQEAMGSDYSSGTGERPEDGNDDDECQIGIPFIGDLVCKAVKMIFDGISALFVKMVDFFGNTSDTFEHLNNDNSFQDSWESVRNISNIIFIIAFLVIIFQYLTNINVVDAYFIKKFLPRVLIAAILVQASWWIVTEMNAFTSDLGSSVRTIVFRGGLSTTASLATGDSAVGQISSGIFAPFSFLGPVGAVIVAAIIGLILLVILLVCVLILALREVLLVVMAIAAPLAFASFAVPQLEGTLKKWLSMYVKLLMMYPIMQLLLSLGVIVGNALGDIGGSPLYKLFGFIAYFLPFVMLPMTYKMGGTMMAKMGGKLAGLGKMGKGVAKDQARKAYGRTNFAQDKDARRSFREGERKEEAEKRLTHTIASTGRVSRFARKGVTDEQKAIAEARHAKHSNRLAEIQEATYASNAKTGSLGLDKKYVDDATNEFFDESGAKIAGGKREALARIAMGEKVTSKNAGGKTEVFHDGIDPETGAQNHLARGAALRLAGQGDVDGVRMMRARADQLMASANPQDREKGTDLMRLTTDAISSNQSAFLSKAPDLIKPPAAAFETGMSGAVLKQFSGATVAANVNYIEQQRAQGELGAQDKFAGAVTDLVNNENEYASLSAGTAEAIHKELARALPQRFGPGVQTTAEDADILDKLKSKFSS